MPRGGKRKGAGRPKGKTSSILIEKEPTKYLPKVPLSKYNKCLAAIKKVLGITTD